MNNVFEYGLLLGLLFLSGFASGYQRQRKRNRSIQATNTPILLAYYSDGIHLTPLRQGKIGDLHYTAILAATTTAKQHIEADPALLFRIELPFASSLHLLGIPKISSIEQIDPSVGKSVMERVELEGDYSNYFTLFCEEGMQMETRYALDPKAMIFTLDFCQSHSWEIVGSELYFVQSGNSSSSNDPTLMYDDIATFVQEIRPTVEKPLTHEQLRNLTPYGKDRRTNLLCPICSKTLDNKDAYYACPDQHGFLLNGASLSKVKNFTLILAGNLPKDDPTRAHNLTCPSCSNTMDHVNYAGSEIVIDSCPNCPYRWLDSGELAHLH